MKAETLFVDNDGYPCAGTVGSTALRSASVHCASVSARLVVVETPAVRRPSPIPQAGVSPPAGERRVLAGRAKDARIIDSPHDGELIHLMNHRRRIYVPT
jgi:hypothetical protein